jgi:hypothetical protein
MDQMRNAVIKNALVMTGVNAKTYNIHLLDHLLGEIGRQLSGTGAGDTRRRLY